MKPKNNEEAQQRCELDICCRAFGGAFILFLFRVCVCLFVFLYFNCRAGHCLRRICVRIEKIFSQYVVEEQWIPIAEQRFSIWMLMPKVHAEGEAVVRQKYLVFAARKCNHVFTLKLVRVTAIYGLFVHSIGTSVRCDSNDRDTNATNKMRVNKLKTEIDVAHFRFGCADRCSILGCDDANR